MAINYPGPFEIRISYSDANISPVIEHVSRFNIALVGVPAQGDVFSNYDIKDIDGDTTVALDTFVEAFLAKFNKLFSNNMDVGDVELWKYPTAQSFDSVFWSSYTPTANAGTGVGSGVPAGQAYYSFRTQEGGNMKVSLMEGIRAAGSSITYGNMTADEKALVDFVLSGNTTTFSAVFLGRDTSYPFSFNRLFPGQNEALFKKRYRA